MTEPCEGCDLNCTEENPQPWLHERTFTCGCVLNADKIADIGNIPLQYEGYGGFIRDNDNGPTMAVGADNIGGKVQRDWKVLFGGQFKAVVASHMNGGTPRNIAGQVKVGAWVVGGEMEEDNKVSEALILNHSANRNQTEVKSTTTFTLLPNSFVLVTWVKTENNGSSGDKLHIDGVYLERQ